MFFFIRHFLLGSFSHPKASLIYDFKFADKFAFEIESAVFNNTADSKQILKATLSL
jgi:hypothetical protein